MGKLLTGFLILVVAIVVFLFFSKQFKSQDGKIKSPSKRVITLGFVAAILLSVALMLSSFIIILQPGEVGLAYGLNVTNASELSVGYNFVAPWSKVYRWDATMQVLTFSQGESNDDIYGAQTLEKDYIEVVATMGVQIDISHMNEYVKMYGSESISSKRIMTMLKTLSRNAIESSIGSYSTAEVMGNKKTISAEAETNFGKALEGTPIILGYFTIDDLIAPETYEASIREQAELRMSKEKATLQQEINQQQALADKAKAEGEAAVLKTQAEAQAEVKRIEAQNAAEVQRIQAENAAEVAKIKADNDAEVQKIAAEAEANVITTKANAEAEATIAQGEAEAKAILAQGEAYKQNSDLIKLKMAEIEAEVNSKWASKWSGYSFEGMTGFSFADLTEVLKELIPGINTSVPDMSND